MKDFCIRENVNHKVILSRRKPIKQYNNMLLTNRVLSISLKEVVPLLGLMEKKVVKTLSWHITWKENANVKIV